MAGAPLVAQDPVSPFQRRLVTPEGLDLRLILASAGERASAFLLDALIIIAVLIVLRLLALAAGVGLGNDSREVVEMIWLLGAFVLRNGYFILFELTGRAATPGKRAMGLRVIARDGGRLSAEAIFVRNAMREIEVFLPLTALGFSVMAGDEVEGVLVTLGLIWTGTFLLFPLFNRDRLRVGDLLAGTWVVRAPKVALLADLAQDAAQTLPRFSFTADQAAVYGIKELEILEDVLRRRDPKAIAAVAERIRAKIDFAQPPKETDRAFLEAYYAALRSRLEHRLLFGHRRADKFDRS